jgi:hypothetical protein
MAEWAWPTRGYQSETSVALRQNSDVAGARPTTRPWRPEVPMIGPVTVIRTLVSMPPLKALGPGKSPRNLPGSTSGCLLQFETSLLWSRWSPSGGREAIVL